MNYYILENKKPVRVKSREEWKRWVEKANRQVDRTELENGVIIVTAFLGEAECLDESTAPLLFETMISGGINNGLIQQYTTWEQALEGHKKAVELVHNE
jgi:hypothetical protein